MSDMKWRLALHVSRRPFTGKCELYNSQKFGRASFCWIRRDRSKLLGVPITVVFLPMFSTRGTLHDKRRLAPPSSDIKVGRCVAVMLSSPETDVGANISVTLARALHSRENIFVIMNLLAALSGSIRACWR